MPIGEKIRTLRREKNMTMAELGEKLGITAAAVSRYELEQREPNFETLKNIAAVLNVTIDELLGTGTTQSLERIKAKEEFFETEKRNEEKFFKDYACLNHTGKAKAHSYVADLAEQSKYTEPELSDEKMEKIPSKK